MMLKFDELNYINLMNLHKRFFKRFIMYVIDCMSRVLSDPNIHYRRGEVGDMGNGEYFAVRALLKKV